MKVTRDIVSVLYRAMKFYWEHETAGARALRVIIETVISYSLAVTTVRWYR